MSLARLYVTNRARKEWKCGKCGAIVAKGEKVIHFAVGFRGYEQHRCGKQSCYPTPSERESSAVATVYAAQEAIDLSTCESLEDLESARDEVVAACEEVADEYESNEMYEINYDLQERAEIIRSAGEELSNWAPDDDEPEAPEDEMSDEELEDFAEEHESWLQEARDSLEDAINSMELP